jgi:glycosyltransferase involved in cell wall biosynthesis
LSGQDIPIPMTIATEPRERPSDTLGRPAEKRVAVTMLCQLFHPELVSTGQTLTELAEQLAATGVDVEVVCGPPTVLQTRGPVPKRMTHHGIRIRRVWGTRFPKLSLAGRVLNQLSFTSSVFFYLLLHRPRRPILVVTNPPFLGFICAMLRAWAGGAPYLYVIFDVYPDTAVHLGLLGARSLVTRLWERLNVFVYERADAVIVIGRCMKGVVDRKSRKAGRDMNGKLHHVHMWCDDQAIASGSSSRNGQEERFGVSGKFVVGYFGNLGRIHDIETIMAAAALLRDHPQVVFLFVGEGHKKRWALDYARRNGLDNCRFHTYVAREELGRLLALADLGLVSLLHGQEGLSVPSKTFGLMAAGVPVLAVVPETSEIARIVAEERCGTLIRPGDERKLAHTILELFGDARARQVMAANGSQAVRDKYSLRDACRRYIDLISRIRP